MSDELDKINLYLFDKYDKQVQASYSVYPCLIHDKENDETIDIQKLITTHSTSIASDIESYDDLYKLYKVFSKPAYSCNIDKRYYYDTKIAPLVSNIYNTKIIKKYKLFIIDLLEIINKCNCI